MRLLRVALCLIALAPSLWLAGCFSDLPHLGDLHDDALYLVSAKSIAEGHGHRILSLPGEPWQTKYPPLFPLWLAGMWKLNPDFPSNLHYWIPLVWIWLPALAIVSLFVFRDLGFDDRWTWGLSIAILFNPIAAYFSVTLMPELMTATLLMSALALAHRGRAALSGLTISIAFLTKTAVLPAMIAIPLWFRKEPQRAAIFIYTSWPTAIAWMIWSALHRVSTGDYYLDYLGYYRANHTIADAPQLFLDNLPILILGTGRLLAFHVSSAQWVTYFTVLIGLVALLSFARLAKGRTVYHAFGIAFLPMLLFWNFSPHERFLIPVLPFILAGLAAELQKLRKTAIALASVIALCVNTDTIFRYFPHIADNERQLTHRLTPVYHWIRENTPPDATFAAFRDPMLYLHTGRHARGMHLPTRFFYRNEQDQLLHYFSDLPTYMRQYKLDYALEIGKGSNMELNPEQLKIRTTRIATDPQLRTLLNTGSETVLRLQSEREGSPASPSPSSSVRASRREKAGHAGSGRIPAPVRSAAGHLVSSRKRIPL